jgi:hypothetical protein
MGEAIVGVLAQGGGLLFSATRDGGAVGVHVYKGDERASDFSASNEDFGALLEALQQAHRKAEAVNTAADGRGPVRGL